MNRLAATFAVAGAVLAGASVYMYRSAPPAPPVAPLPTAAGKPAAPPVAGSAPTPATAPAATPTARTTPRRPATPKETPAPAPATPVDASPETATLTIASDVAGAQVFLDRQFVGAAPATAKNVSPGPHQLNVSAPGYDNHVQTIDVVPGARDITVSFREVRLDESIEVVHKHRMGSCRGRLLATPAGLRYQTTDKEDGFSAPLSDLETFQVDYLSKNLRVQPRKGKRYDFTDPEGNADRLFVFHRDVDRARERLRKGDLPAGKGQEPLSR